MITLKTKSICLTSLLSFKILLQTAVKMSTMESPYALTYSGGMLSTQTDSPYFSALAATLTSSRKIGRGSSYGICRQLSTVEVLLNLYQSYSCISLNSTLSIC